MLISKFTVVGEGLGYLTFESGHELFVADLGVAEEAALIAPGCCVASIVHLLLDVLDVRGDARIHLGEEEA